MAIIDKLQKRLLAAAALTCTVIIAITFMIKPKNEIQHSVPAIQLEANSEKGVPTITDTAAHYGTLEIPLSTGSCKVSMDATPKLNVDQLDVYFTNSAENTMGLKLVIFNGEDQVIGESGIVRNGEYVESVKLNEKHSDGEQLKAKILTYETDTNYSLGSASVTLMTR